MAVTAIVRFTLPEGKTHEEMAAAFERSAPLTVTYRGWCANTTWCQTTCGPAAGSICSSRAPTPSASTTTPGAPGCASAWESSRTSNTSTRRSSSTTKSGLSRLRPDPYGLKNPDLYRRITAKTPTISMNT